MVFHSQNINSCVKFFNSDKEKGLSENSYRQNIKKYGKNVLSKKKSRSLISKFFDALKEPMLIILLFGFIITFGTNLGKWLKSGEGDFSECFGILFAVFLSVSITLIMEGSSQKAFDALNRIYDNIGVRVIRFGKVVTISQTDVCVGDVVILENGDKIVADGRLIESHELMIDESTLTGESQHIKKDCNVLLKESVALAERVNCVYSGTFVVGGTGKMLVTAVGDNTEIGNIAGELSEEKGVNTPLQAKLAKLGKVITIVGVISAVSVFLISAIRLAVLGDFTFYNVQELFISCIVLIVAAVPEGLPTIVAISLALNMIKLAKQNALIKKMSATETAGAVSVICSDKTGTLTQNKMTVVGINVGSNATSKQIMYQNFACNSTADVSMQGKKTILKGSGTECALLVAFNKFNPKQDYLEYRRIYPIVERQPFSSDKKIMQTTIKVGDKERTLIKGAPEKVLGMCELSLFQRGKIENEIKLNQEKARRVLCFAHKDGDQGICIYDGFVSITDPVRKEVLNAVKDCKKAGINIKMLTGDNIETAYAIARELGIVKDISQLISGSEIEKLSDEKLKTIIPNISVIARSTPIIKLRVVRALKELGEVVAVTGDGINDAPAIKHSDVGIAMGISGSEITKEAADIVLLDDSFNTVVKAVAFGRNVYKNLQRFILFQLSVNLSALLFITVCAILNLPSPFNTLQLLWVNLIMDGPPALTLGLESADAKIMQYKPVKRTDGIVGLKMFIRIIFNGVYVGAIMLLQYLFNFLQVEESQKGNAIFTLFILFQLFNAFNSRELGAESIFKSIGRNKVMVITFICVFVAHYIIVQAFSPLFGINPMNAKGWLGTILTASSIITVSEVYKLAYRRIKGVKKVGLWRKSKVVNQQV